MLRWVFEDTLKINNPTQELVQF